MSMCIRHVASPCLLICCLLPGTIQPEASEPINLTRLGQREFVLDRANLIDPADEQQIKRIAEKLLTDKAVPIIVVTIDSMSAHHSGALGMERFARNLFNQWGVGLTMLGDRSWIYGILLLVSKNDRKARIELGAD
jgi:uncharacterized protein